MNRPSASVLKPRKTPRQARSAATVDAIHTATIQLLLAEGPSRLTTTRVADRAGVSVGTMYQYFPHKQALLFAILERHVGALLGAVDEAIERLDGATLEDFAIGLSKAWLDAKIADITSSRALYAVAAEFDIAEMLETESARFRQALEAALSNLSDAKFTDPTSAALMVTVLLGGSVRAVFEGGAKDQHIQTLRRELPRICHAYLVSCAA